MVVRFNKQGHILNQTYRDSLDVAEELADIWARGELGCKVVIYQNMQVKTARLVVDTVK